MPLRFCADSAPAPWPLEAFDGTWTFLEFGPAGLEASCRLLWLPDPTHVGQREHEAGADLPEDWPGEAEQLAVALEILADFTATPDEVFYATWEGMPPHRPEPTTFSLADWRAYHLFRGSLHDLGSWQDALAGRHDRIAPPSFVWPADRAWIIASDVDPHFAGVGGSAPAIAALLAEPTLRAVPADRAAPQPRYR